MTHETTPIAVSLPPAKHNNKSSSNYSIIIIKNSMMESCSSISLMDSMSTNGMWDSYTSVAFPTLDPPTSASSGIRIGGNPANAKTPPFMVATKEQQLLAKRKRAMVRHSKSFDSVGNLPPAFQRRPRPKRDGPRRHKSTPATATEPQELQVHPEENATPESVEPRGARSPITVLPQDITVVDSRDSIKSSRWESNSGHSSRRSSCPAVCPSRQDSSSDFNAPCGDRGPRREVDHLSTRPKPPQRQPSSGSLSSGNEDDESRKEKPCLGVKLGQPPRCYSPPRSYSHPLSQNSPRAGGRI